ncbi:hypothetical protein XBP1_1080012 [Xenorhabdus bovienii str. puntauvense]|uniref:Uncharacterized protein n=1 Tax=Xenorhabdus bovienii str. puntauvense TaxID=1398201 RepID=A0A077N801_XENBV|nr:hypothetical protein XBP1_1080012 [Xenorhabdus bovienii str. puntauvense]
MGRGTGSVTTRSGCVYYRVAKFILLIPTLVVARAFNPFPKIDDLEAPLVAAVGVLLFIRHLTKLGVSQYFNFINGLHTLRAKPEKGLRISRNT